MTNETLGVSKFVSPVISVLRDSIVDITGYNINQKKQLYKQLRSRFSMDKINITRLEPVLVLLLGMDIVMEALDNEITEKAQS